MKSDISSTVFGRRTVIQAHNSRYLLLLAVSLHLAALMLLFLIDLNIYMLSILALLILISLRLSILSELTVKPGLSLQPGEPLLLHGAGQAGWQQSEVLGSFISSWLIVVRIKVRLDGSQHTLVYATDSIDRHAFRRLTVFLKPAMVSA